MTEPFDRRSPLEVSVGGPGFRLFWDAIMGDLDEFEKGLLAEAQLKIVDGNNAEALVLLTRATSVKEVINRLKNAPKRAIEKEEEKRNGRRDPSRNSGYDSI